MTLTRFNALLFFAFIVYTCSAQSPTGLRGITGSTGATGSNGATGNAYLIGSSELNSDSIKFERQLSVMVTPIPCKQGTSGDNCVCPANCLTYYNSTGGCHPNDCWKWSEVKDECAEAGKPFIPAIVLQAIPVTGVFGSGWGNIERWDIFNIYMAVVFGPLTIVILACCCAMGGFCAQNEDRLACYNCLGTCLGCLWAVAIVALWIWGIVAIANKPDAPWVDWQGDAIMCALVD